VASDDEIKRGGDAASVLDSSVFIAARKHVLEGIERQMRAVPMANQEMHSRLILTLQCWDGLEKYLEQIKQTGEIAQFTIKQEEERRARFKLFG
jgi:hypothetical protein